MSRTTKGLARPARQVDKELLAVLVEELERKRDFGQPHIEEEIFPRTNLIKVTVLWDRWREIPDIDRTETILQAYEKVEGKDYRDRITLAGGYTYPEAHEMGYLPYRIIPAVRPGDPVQLDQCYDAMVGQGASTLFDPETPLLLLPNRAETEACKRRLIKDLPGSENVWLWEKDFSPPEYSNGE